MVFVVEPGAIVEPSGVGLAASSPPGTHRRYASAGGGEWSGMARVLGVRWWQPMVSVVVAALLGAVTNLVTGEFSWALAAAVVVLVVVQAGLVVRQGRQDLQARRAARDGCWGSCGRRCPKDPTPTSRVWCSG
jgi:hypothetical protein